MLPECPHCRIVSQSSQAQFCARCGKPLPTVTKPIMIQKPRSLFSPGFGLGLAVAFGGTALATMGHLYSSAVTLCLSVLILLVVVVRDHSR